jgi:hypothetical protein
MSGIPRTGVPTINGMVYIFTTLAVALFVVIAVVVGVAFSHTGHG